MSHRQPARTSGRRTRPTVLAVLVVLVVLVAVLGHWPLDVSASAAPPTVSEPSGHRSEDPGLGNLPGRPQRGRHGALGVADGEVPDGVTVFDDDVPAVANLDPDLLGALRRAASDAAGDGVELYVNSGWRSAAYQRQLLDEAVSTYGSTQAASRWVATPSTSPHVSGDAVDIGPSDAATWLAERGVGYGLCQIYRNEPWHFELRPDAVDLGCPPTYADPTHDPRMQR